MVQSSWWQPKPLMKLKRSRSKIEETYRTAQHTAAQRSTAQHSTAPHFAATKVESTETEAQAGQSEPTPMEAARSGEMQ